MRCGHSTRLPLLNFCFPHICCWVAFHHVGMLCPGKYVFSWLFSSFFVSRPEPFGLVFVIASPFSLAFQHVYAPFTSILHISFHPPIPLPVSQSLHFYLSTIFVWVQLRSSNEHLWNSVISACILTNFLLYYYHCNTIGACYFSGLWSSRVWHNETPASWPVQGQSGESQVGVLLCVVAGPQWISRPRCAFALSQLARPLTHPPSLLVPPGMCVDIFHIQRQKFNAERLARPVQLSSCTIVLLIIV